LRKINYIIIIGILLILLSATANSSLVVSFDDTDFDPLVDVSVTVDIEAIRYLEKDEPEVSARSLARVLFNRLPLFRSFIKKPMLIATAENDLPDFFVKVIINDVEFTSNVWTDMEFVYEPWSATLNVPDEQEFVNIVIQLYSSITGDNTDGILYDISGDSDGSDDSYDVELTYNIKTGHWTGDDALSDASGYGRLCGCDDGTIYQNDRDCEIWFNIFQNDYDDDGIPYWTEVNDYATDPEVKNDGDPDGDTIPVEWEYKWGYNPFSPENHEKLDSDGDSLNNTEEYLTSAWFSDPFRKDVFVEMDKMDDGPNGEKVYFPAIAEELITTAFNRQNIVFHLDMGDMGGYETYPFDAETSYRELRDIYDDYFLHGDQSNWRRGVFHYGIVTYSVDGPPGYMFRSNAYQVSSSGMEEKADIARFQRDIVYASNYMHELGHTFAFNPIPGHNDGSKYPWQPGYWTNRPYKSCMNYGWVYQIVDYSDGSRAEPDIDDGSRINYHAFEHEWN